jgi:hypothetical protein
LNPLIFTEDGCDTYLNAEHYVMLGNFDRDPDVFPTCAGWSVNSSLPSWVESEDEAVVTAG